MGPEPRPSRIEQQVRKRPSKQSQGAAAGRCTRRPGPGAGEEQVGLSSRTLFFFLCSLLSLSRIFDTLSYPVPFSPYKCKAHRFCPYLLVLSAPCHSFQRGGLARTSASRIPTSPTSIPTTQVQSVPAIRTPRDYYVLGFQNRSLGPFQAPYPLRSPLPFLSLHPVYSQSPFQCLESVTCPVSGSLVTRAHLATSSPSRFAAGWVFLSKARALGSFPSPCQLGRFFSGEVSNLRSLVPCHQTDKERPWKWDGV